MKLLLQALLVIAVFVLFIRLMMRLFFVRRFNDGDDIRTTYIVTFKDVPDISTNPTIMEKVRIKVRNANGYVVESRINDTVLKDLLIHEYHVKPTQVNVHSRLFMNLP